MKYVLTISILILFINSCVNKNRIEFNVQNNTDSKIDSIAIYVRGSKNNKTYFYLKPNETKTYNLDMSNIGMGDGDYRIDYQLSNPRRKKLMHFGYFTNGSAQDELIKIKIEHDTILFEYK